MCIVTSSGASGLRPRRRFRHDSKRPVQAVVEVRRGFGLDGDFDVSTQRDAEQLLAECVGASASTEISTLAGQGLSCRSRRRVRRGFGLDGDFDQTKTARFATLDDCGRYVGALASAEVSTISDASASGGAPIVKEMQPLLQHVAPSPGALGACLVWRFPIPLLAASSSIVGGGIGPVEWVLNMTVDSAYSRMDPIDHLEEVAQRLGLSGRGAALMTAVDVACYRTASIGGAIATATVGVSNPVWAASRHNIAVAGDATGTSGSTFPSTYPGTINVVVEVPVRLSHAALINAIVTITEAKVQALLDHGIDGTGTASDAVCVLCPVDAPIGTDVETFGGPRSIWGERVAQASYDSIVAGLVQQRNTRR